MWRRREGWRDDWEAALEALRRPQLKLAAKGCDLLVSLLQASCELGHDDLGPDDLDDEDWNEDDYDVVVEYRP